MIPQELFPQWVELPTIRENSKEEIEHVKKIIELEARLKKSEDDLAEATELVSECPEGSEVRKEREVKLEEVKKIIRETSEQVSDLIKNLPCIKVLATEVSSVEPKLMEDQNRCLVHMKSGSIHKTVLSDRSVLNIITHKIVNARDHVGNMWLNMQHEDRMRSMQLMADASLNSQIQNMMNSDKKTKGGIVTK